jgi:putative DNA primase/helicase
MKKEFQHKVPITQDQFNREWYYFNTQDGMIDLRTCSMVPHDKDRYINRISGTGISTDDCPVWKNFLDTILGNDRELMRFVQKALGYSLSGTNAEQCFFFLLGSGSNGKSTMMDIIRKVFGEYAANAQAETIMIKGTAAAGAARSDIARLKDVRLLTVSEPEEGSRLNESLMKQFVGGDPLTTRFNYGIDFEYVPCLVPWIPTNYKPIIRGTDQGIWRRIRIIPFRVEIPDSKKDKQLPAKLARELPMIANWVLDGYKLYRSEGLHPPAVVSDAVREYRREMDVVSSFITECCILGQGSEKSSVLYAVYIRWAETNNEFKLSHRRFSAELMKKDGIEKVRSDGMIYKGITILDEYRYE